MSPKLFTLALEKNIQIITSGKKSINIDDAYLNYLQNGNSMVLISRSGKNAERTSLTSKSKIKILGNSQEDIYCQNTKLNNLAEYIYLEHTIRLGKLNE